MCLSIILIWVIVSHKYQWSLKKKKKKKKNFFFAFFFLLFLIGITRHGIGEKGGYFRLEWGRNLAPREGQKIPCIKKRSSFNTVDHHQVVSGSALFFKSRYNGVH